MFNKNGQEPTGMWFVAKVPSGFSFLGRPRGRFAGIVLVLEFIRPKLMVAGLFMKSSSISVGPGESRGGSHEKSLSGLFIFWYSETVQNNESVAWQSWFGLCTGKECRFHSKLAGSQIVEDDVFRQYFGCGKAVFGAEKISVGVVLVVQQ